MQKALTNAGRFIYNQITNLFFDKEDVTMHRICKRITALALVLLMTASLLASCSGGGEKPKRESDKSIPIYDSYAGSVVDIGLTEN